MERISTVTPSNPETYRDGMPEDAKGEYYQRLTGKRETTLMTRNRKEAQQWIDAGWFVVKCKDWTGRWVETWNDHSIPKALRKAVNH